MKKLLLALLLALAPVPAFAQCTGLFQPGTLCGNNTGSPAPPKQVPASSVTGPGTTVVNDLALWANTIGTSLKDSPPAALTSVNDTNVTLSVGGLSAIALVNASSVTAGWTGTLAAGRLNSNVVQSIINDTNINGAIAAQALTFSWAGTLAAGRLNSNVVQSVVNDTNVTGSIAAQALTLGWTGTLAIGRGGTGSSTQPNAAIAIFPTPTRAGDIVYWDGAIWNHLAGNNVGVQFLQEDSFGAPSWVTVSGTGTVTSVVAGNGLTGGTITTTGTITAPVFPPQGRLTLTTNTPIMTASATAQSTLRYDCYYGGAVPYYNGSIDTFDSISSCEVTDAMISGATAGQVVGTNLFDVWWVHGGANRICLAMSASVGGGGGWSADTGGSNTARGSGYSQLDYVTRPYVTNKNSITNCFNNANNYGPVSANQGTYLGTIFSTANGQTSYTFGAAASGGTAAVFGVCNYYNRRPVASTVTDNGAAYTYATATIRQARASAGNQIQTVSCDATWAFDVAYRSNTTASTVATDSNTIGIGLDVTNAFTSPAAICWADGVSNQKCGLADVLRSQPSAGIHTFSGNETGDTSTSTFNNNSTNQLTIYFDN